MSKPLEVITDEVARRGQAPTENQIRNAIVEYLVYRGWLILRVNSGAAVTTENGKRRFVHFVRWFAAGEGAQTAGVSDLICFKTGQPPLAIETKRPGNTPTEAQKRFMTAWAVHGGVWVIAECVDDVVKALGE